MSDYRERLEQFLRARNEAGRITQLTPDASTREYFRIDWRENTAVACVYPESFIESEQSYLDVSRLFRHCGLPVAEVFDFDETLGVIVIEDLGDTILRDVLEKASTSQRESLIDKAISLIPKIQAATQTAFDTGSIASRLKFDKEKLVWELQFFKTHYFHTFRGINLPTSVDVELTSEFERLSEKLEARASVLCHRDFHAANLMIDRNGSLRVIDHQDARIGPVSYDLVSLLLDRVTDPPSAEWLASKRRLFLSERNRLDMNVIDEDDLTEEFRLQTVQRCLKAVGTFSYQSSMRGKTYFIPFIKPMFLIVLRALEHLERFPHLSEVVRKETDQTRE